MKTFSMLCMLFLLLSGSPLFFSSEAARTLNEAAPTVEKEGTNYFGNSKPTPSKPGQPYTGSHCTYKKHCHGKP